MKRILFVDDEKNFLLSLVQWLQAKYQDFVVEMAADGREALEFLRAHETDLVVTDLHMPVMDGFQLLAEMNREFPHIPAIIMTAFGTPEIKERLDRLGWGRFLDKPIDIEELESNILDVFDQNTRGTLQGISLATFVQIISMESKSCTLRINSEKKNGVLYFVKGDLVDAVTGKLTGEEAACEILSWPDITIEVKKAVWRRKKRVKKSLEQVLLESCEYQDRVAWADDNGETESIDLEDVVTDEAAPEYIGTERNEQKQTAQNFQRMEEIIMNVQEQLAEFKAVDGFMGAGLFTPGGEALAMLAEDKKIALQEIGILANNVLMNAQKASLEMGTGRGQLVHIEAEKAHILVRCLNEGDDPIASEPGKAHIHLVVILNSDNIGMAKLKLSKIIEKVAGEFRG